MQFEPLDIASLIQDPTYYFHSIRWKFRDARFVRLSEADHQFHSSHAARACPLTYDIPTEGLLEAYGRHPLQPRPIRYIFMTDFCGSTLLARALGKLDGLFCYNEPRAFVSLSNEKRRIDLDGTGNISQWQSALNMAVGLMARTFTPNNMALIKDQPLTNYIIRDLLEANEDSAAIFLYSTLPDYLAAVFREDRRRAYARERVTRHFRETANIPHLAGIDKVNLSDARVAALHWLIQMYHYLNVSRIGGVYRLRSLRSDVFRARPEEVLKSVAGFYGVQVTEEAIVQLLKDDIFLRHSKRVGELYDAQAELGRDLALATQYRDDIEDALAWATAVSADWPIPDVLPNPLQLQSF